MPVRLPWKADKYAQQLPARPNGFDSLTEERLSEQFPPLSARPFPKVTLPSTLVDTDDVILAWFLPGAFSASRQVSRFHHKSCQQCSNFDHQISIWEALQWLQPLFHGGLSDGCWRVNNEFFKAAEQCDASAPGCVNFSPAWFEQAQDVCEFML